MGDVGAQILNPVSATGISASRPERGAVRGCRREAVIETTGTRLAPIGSPTVVVTLRFAACSGGGGLPGTLKPKRQCSPGTRRPHTESLPPILVFDTYHSLLVLPTRTPSSHFPYRSVVNPWLIRLLSSSLLLLPSFLLPQTWRGRSYLISRHSGIAPPKLTLPRGIRVSQRACDPLDQGTISKFP